LLRWCWGGRTFFFFISFGPTGQSREPRHELRDHAVEAASLVPAALLGEAQLLEVLSLWDRDGVGVGIWIKTG
jgi:hypothetical protein